MTAYGGDIIYARDVNRPVTRLVQQAAQSLANSTDTALTFGAGSEDFDLGGWHSETTNNTRITPTIPGYYQVVGTVFLAASSAVTSCIATIAKNGTVQAPRSRMKPGANNLSGTSTVTVTLYLNGTTDYVELIGQQTSGGALNTNVGGSFASVFEVQLVQPM